MYPETRPSLRLYGLLRGSHQSALLPDDGLLFVRRDYICERVQQLLHLDRQCGTLLPLHHCPEANVPLRDDCLFARSELLLSRIISAEHDQHAIHRIPVDIPLAEHENGSSDARER